MHSGTGKKAARVSLELNRNGPIVRLDWLHDVPAGITVWLGWQQWAYDYQVDVRFSSGDRYVNVKLSSSTTLLPRAQFKKRILEPVFAALLAPRGRQNPSRRLKAKVKR